MVVMTDALKRYEWTPPPLAPLARRVLALAERPSTATDVARQQVRALEDRLRAALAVLSATDDQDEQSMAAAVHEVLESLKALHSLGVDHADGLAARRDAIEALSTMRASTIAAGLLSPAHWDRAADRLGADVSDERAAALAMRMEGLGALFVAAEDNSALRVAPWLETAISAMTSLMGAGLDDGASRDIPPLGPLSMAEGPPAPELLERAADRLRKFEAWLETHASALPETLLRPVLRFATVRVALDAAADVASAYAQPAYGNTEGSSRNDAYAYNDTTAPNLRYVVSSLVRLAPGISRDIAWLAGVRAFRALEAIDADFERTNTFDLRPVVAQWSGHGPVLKGSEWRDAQLRRAHLTEGWLRLGSAVDRATPLLDVLRAPEVAEALESPPLIDKWLGLQQTISIGESALDAFAAFLETSVIGFDRNSCGVTVRAPAESVIGRGLRHEAEALSHELETRCIDILRAPLPLPKPRIYAAPPYRFVPW